MAEKLKTPHDKTGFHQVDDLTAINKKTDVAGLIQSLDFLQFFSTGQCRQKYIVKSIRIVKKCFFHRRNLNHLDCLFGYLQLRNFDSLMRFDVGS
eukprot:CAMPEP_0114573968 /NCGR_PEP_ID=MMETSP0114-20121206/19149_1 /TAXON_ID=31324 /ORGANISM="Goniomonas sp, Strain m" /LENGTH=94 /DNA_ID=CAMNT_0001761363 /DNA_START=876 /DNA_END=1160 /DNA_ORIENTATION=+